MLLGGTLAVESPVGGGTTVRATLPLAPVRLPHRQFFQMGAQTEASIERILSGTKTVGISLAREWATEGGPPRLGQIVPVMDAAGRHRVDVEVTGLELVAFRDIDLATYAAAGVDGAALADCQAAVRAFYTGNRDALAVLFDAPGWTLELDEPMVLLRHRVAVRTG
jgi:uncharacterized protein YhfF